MRACIENRTTRTEVDLLCQSKDEVSNTENVCLCEENQKQQIKLKHFVYKHQDRPNTHTQTHKQLTLIKRPTSTRKHNETIRSNKCEECMGQRTMSTHIQAVISPAEMHSENEST